MRRIPPMVWFALVVVALLIVGVVASLETTTITSLRNLTNALNHDRLH